jgi:signal peptidase I
VAEERAQDGPAAPVTPAAVQGSAAPDAGRHARRSSERARARRALRELPILLVVALLLALLIKAFLIQAFYIPSQSMEPTLRVGDRVLVNELAYRGHLPNYGDVIVFRSPSEHAASNPFSAFWQWVTSGLGVGPGAHSDYIKRVIGLPGDTVEISHGVVVVNGHRLNEPYVSSDRDFASYGPYHVPAGDLFVLGDNRTDSGDSRWSPRDGGLGYIPVSKVVGRAFAIIWPPGQVGGLGGLAQS